MIRGGIRKAATTRPLRSPVSAPLNKQKSAMEAALFESHHVLRSNTSVNVMTKPIDRSKPPAIMTMVSANATMINGAASRLRSRR